MSKEKNTKSTSKKRRTNEKKKKRNITVTKKEQQAFLMGVMAVILAILILGYLVMGRMLTIVM